MNRAERETILWRDPAGRGKRHAVEFHTIDSRDIVRASDLRPVRRALCGALALAADRDQDPNRAQDCCHWCQREVDGRDGGFDE